jgi:hypothetical protein
LDGSVNATNSAASPAEAGHHHRLGIHHAQILQIRT